MTDPFDHLRPAIAAKVALELAPLMARAGALSEGLAVYMEASRESAEVRVLSAVLAALGQPVAPADGTRLLEAETRLWGAFTALFGVPQPDRQPEPAPSGPPATADDLAVMFGDESGPAVEIVAEPAPLPTAQVPAWKKSQKAPTPPKVDLSAVARGEELLAAAEKLQGTATTHHPIRLGLLIQELLAQVRMVMERIPPSHDLHARLGDSAICGLARIREKFSPDTYVKGLVFGSRYDWNKLVSEAQRKIKAFDADAARGVGKSGSGASNGKAAREAEVPSAPSYEWPKLALLRHRIEGHGPVVIAGGIKKEEKLAAVQERFGVACEWHEIDKNNPRATDALCVRIRSGKVSGLVMLEGLMGHKTWKKLEAALRSQPYIPSVFGDTGGIARLGEAIETLERRIAIVEYRIPMVS